MRSALKIIVCGAALAGLGITGVSSAKAGPVPKEQVAAYERGKAEAERALAGKKPVMGTFGLSGPWRADYADILREKCGVGLVTVAGRIVDDEILGHARGVNAVTEAWLKIKYGPDVLEKAEADAENRYAARHSKPVPESPKSSEPKSA